MNEPRTLAELSAFDEMTRAFWPGGLAGALMSPEDSLYFLRSSLEHADLVDAVPEEVCNNFERVRKTYLYGLMEYDLFTVADDNSRLVLEGALRARFASYYDGEIALLRDGKRITVRGTSFDDYRRRFNSGDVLVTRNGRHHSLRVGMRGLLTWARAERLLDGQRSVMTDKTMSTLRNYVAHPSGFHRRGPPDASRTIGRVAEYINKLWGSDTPGGRLFPGPVERRPRAVALAHDGTRFVAFSTIGAVRTADSALHDAVFAVYLAPAHEDLYDTAGGLHLRHRPGFQSTTLPCELLWGPGPRSDLLSQLSRFEAEAVADSVPYLDRVFVVRVDGEQIDQARSPDDFAASPVTGGEWHVIRADYPQDAFRHVRDHGSLPARARSGDVRCRECPVTVLGHFTSRDEVAKCLAGHDLSP